MIGVIPLLPLYALVTQRHLHLLLPFEGSRSERKYDAGLFTRNYLLTPCSTVLLEKLTRFQLVKKFPAFHGNRRFITALTSALHLPLS